jgi:hypothetical protein
MNRSHMALASGASAGVWITSILVPRMVKKLYPRLYNAKNISGFELELMRMVFSFYDIWGCGDIELLTVIVKIKNAKPV